jgi:hypothetical protein
MKKISFLILITTLSLSISSCSYFESFNEKRKEVEESSKPTIKINATAEGEAQEEKDPLAEAVEEAEATEREQDIVGLIPSTKPEIRVRNSVRGRQDPFSTIAVEPQIEIEPEEEPDVDNGSQQPSNNNNNGATRPDNITSTPTIETLDPEPPKGSLTELAQNVLITGLVNLGDRIKLIVQAPEEATSRYVDVGQYISNGRVLVKRIEFNSPYPTVILEESGIEVAKEIGEPIAEETDEQAFLPPPPMSNTAAASWLSN